MSAELLGGARALEEVAAARARMCHGFVPVRHGKEGEKKEAKRLGLRGQGLAVAALKLPPARPCLAGYRPISSQCAGENTDRRVIQFWAYLSAC